jgi:hypothetical protein
MKASVISRAMLAVAAAIHISGAAIHASAYPRVAPIFDAAPLSPFMTGASKALWLLNSSNLVVFGVTLGLIAARPASASSLLLSILAIGPLVSAVLTYVFVGPFFAGYLMIAASALMFCSAALGRKARLSAGEQSWAKA